MTEQQYYEKGLKFIENENPNGAIIAFKKAIEKDPNFFEARYQLALAYIKQKKYESAEKELLKVLRLNPSYTGTHMQLAKIYLRTGETEDSIKEINKYLDEEGDEPEAYEIAASAYMLKEDYEKAEDLLKDTIKRVPDRSLSKIILAELYLHTGKTEEAEKLVDEVLAIENENKRALYTKVRILRKRGDIKEIIAAYKRILELDPDAVNPNIELGLVYLQAKDIEKARELAEGLKRTRPGRPEGHFLAGLVEFQERKIDEALVSLRHSISKGSIPGAHYYLGLSYMAKGNLEQATSQFQRVLDLNPVMIEARLMLAVTHLKNKRLEEARRETLRALEIDENNASAHNLLGSVYIGLGENELAMDEFDRAIELNPGLIDAHVKKGAFSLLAGDKAAAEQKFIDAVEIAPELLNTRIILARYYIKNKNYKKAVDTLEEGLNNTPSDAILYNIIGAARLGQGRVDSAVENFSKAIEANPRFFLPYFNLGRLYVSRNEKEKAIAQYEKVLDIDNTHITAVLMIAGILESDNKDEEALSYYLRATKQGSPAAYLALADFYVKRGGFEKAIEALDEAIRLNPEDLKAIDMKGKIYIATKNYTDALNVYRKLTAISGKLGRLRTAGVYAVMGEYGKAVHEYETLLSMDVKKDGVMRRIVNLHIKNKNYREAEKTAARMIEESNENEEAYRLLAQVYVAASEFDKALSTLRKAGKLYPENLSIKLARGTVYISMKDYGRAMDIFRKLEKENPGYTPAIFYQASILERTGREKEAIKKYKLSLDKDPGYAPSLNNLAYLYLQGYGSAEEAVHMARKAYEIAPGDGRISDTLGWTLFNRGDYDDALKHFIKAAYYLPDMPTIRYHLGLSYLKKGMAGQAKKEFEAAINMGSKVSFPEMNEAKKELEKINNK